MLSCTKEFAQGPAGGPSYSNIAEASRVLLLLDLKFSDAVCSFNYDFISKTLSITLNANVQKVTWRFLWWFLWLNCGSTVAQNCLAFQLWSLRSKLDDISVCLTQRRSIAF